MNKYFLLLLFVASLFSACSESSPKKVEAPQTPPETKQPTTIEEAFEATPMVEANVTNAIKVQFDCKVSDQSTDVTPLYDLLLMINDQPHSIQQVNACEKMNSQEDYDRYKIPMMALSAAGGWWAGAGDYFYVVVDAKTIDVFHGTQDEGSETSDFGYKKIKTIPIPEA